MTCTMPRRTTSPGSLRWIGSPSSSTEPLVTSPRSVRSRPEMALRVVDLPAPLAPRRATMPPSGTRSETPRNTRITWSYITSMLLTDRIGRDIPFPALTSLLLLAAVALRVAALLGLVDGGPLDLRADDVLHGLDPVRDDVPLLAVPLLDQDRAAALVVLARDLDRVREALHSDLLEALLGLVQVLEAPAHLL